MHDIAIQSTNPAVIVAEASVWYMAGLLEKKKQNNDIESSLSLEMCLQEKGEVFSNAAIAVNIS